MKKIVLMLCLLGFLAPARAQHAVEGRVVAARDLLPLPGATVRLTSRPGAVLTNAEGRFHLPAAAAGDTLLVSFLGYVPRRLPLPATAGPLEIALQENAQALQEVVVSTGYQRLPRERATGSFTQLDEATLNRQVGTDILSRLEAVAGGVTVDRSGIQQQLMVRGLSTINGSQAPLIVVDNFPYEGDIANLNPNDVASITILKDAAAASIWGARAGNGVIVITTKKGRFHQPLAATLHLNVTRSARPDLSYLQPMRATDYIDVEQFLFEQGYFEGLSGGYGQPVLSPVVELLFQQQNGTLPAGEVAARLNALRSADVREDYKKYIYQPALKQQYALDLQSGSEVLAWHLSGGYDRNIDQLDARYNRLNLRFDNTLRPARHLTLTTGAAYTQSESTGGRPGYGQIGYGEHFVLPYTRFADEAGNPLPFPKDYQQAFKDTAGGGHLLDWNYYPLEDYKHVQDETGLQDVTANAGLAYDWPQGLRTEVRYQYERQQTSQRLLQDAQSYAARHLVNLFSQRDPETGTFSYPIPRGGMLDLRSSLLVAQHLRAQLSFDHTWNRHALTALAGAELRQARTTGYSSRRYGYNPAKLTSGRVDYAVPYPDFVTGYAQYIPDLNGEEARLSRFVSQFANAAYTYHDRYTLSLSARRDASNLFGLHTNDKWNPLWSAGLGWELSREPFYHQAWLPYLKLRSTYGFSGNTNPAFTAVSTIAYVVTSPYTQLPYARFATYANPDLTWETVRMWNTGLDFGTKNSRLSGSLEYYRKKAFDLFALYPVDYTTGVGDQVVRNVATITGQGADLTLASTNLQGALGWTSQLNWSFNQDRVRDYYLGTPAPYQLVSPGSRVPGVEGKPVYALYSYKWAGLDPQTGAPQGYVNGEVSQDYNAIVYGDLAMGDLVYHGSALPTAYGSLGNTFTWKGFSLTAAISWKLGYYFRAPSISYPALFDGAGGHADFARRWQKPGDEQLTHVPALAYPGSSARDAFYSGSGVLVEKGDHVRLQYLTAAYDLVPTHPGKSTFTRLQLYLSGSHLGILWRANRLGLDPDQYKYNALPEPASLSLGVRASL
ncbi:SusC/RagA family TonB-linked outer membrane protein [Pontibacter liquoris]|uniref:SusC/RagA family TonB-linked outer membrane protein n=1 Tax=Pontibacter liquoris TaxID=2905677 RepID=UPI001FA81433|nr:SusC/RagA family TonB-linked outer membrane protein [Pontibacter liquoris]